MNKAVFLDRDGTINEDYGYVYKIQDFNFIKNSIEGIKLLYENNYKIYVVTNQSGVSRGYYTIEDLKRINIYLEKKLNENGIMIEDILYCTHLPNENCLCRKPKTGLIKDLLINKINKHKSYVIGDKITDIGLANNAGLKSILISKKLNFSDPRPDYICENLLDAANKIINS